MKSVVDWFSVMLHKPIGQLTLLELGGSIVIVVLAYLILAAIVIAVIHGSKKSAK